MVDTSTDFSLLGNEYIESYYTHPDPHGAIEALEGYLQSPFVADAAAQVPVGYFYARLAQLHPHLIDEYVRLLVNVNSTAETFIQGILADLRKSPPDPVNILERAIRAPTDNDLLWVEFALTGSKKPVARIVDQLELIDKVRHKLEIWLTDNSKSPIGQFTSWRISRGCQRLQQVTGIVCNLELKTIVTTGDLDCACMMRGLERPTPARVLKARRVLPFNLSEAEWAEMIVKVSAKWSLACQARTHARVLQICKDELRSRSGQAYHSLLEITTSAKALAGT